MRPPAWKFGGFWVFFLHTFFGGTPEKYGGGSAAPPPSISQTNGGEAAAGARTERRGSLRAARLPPPPAPSPAAGQQDYSVPWRESASRRETESPAASICEDERSLQPHQDYVWLPKEENNALKPLTSTAVLNRITRQLQCDYRTSVSLQLAQMRFQSPLMTADGHNAVSVEVKYEHLSHSVPV